MAKKIMQFRYYGEKNSKNQPNNISKSNLATGQIFSNYFPITQLGIQTQPGTKFYLNNGTSPIIIGSTGIYELNLEGISSITQLSFDLTSLNLINRNPNGYLIIDVLGESVEG